jgi:hypothetical protein
MARIRDVWTGKPDLQGQLKIIRRIRLRNIRAGERAPLGTFGEIVDGG